MSDLPLAGAMSPNPSLDTEGGWLKSYGVLAWKDKRILISCDCSDLWWIWSHNTQNLSARLQPS